MATNGLIYGVVKRLNNIFHMQQHQCSNMNGVKSWKWDITQITSPTSKTLHKYAVLILNRPIVQNQDFMAPFWNNATVRMTIDGGTVQWDRYASKLSQDVKATLAYPTLITGDFDSVTADILEKYKQKCCKVVHTPDQNHTDFTKALMELNTYCRDKAIVMDYVVAVCQSSGRIDHIFGNIQTLYLNKVRELLDPTTKLFILSDDALSWLLSPGDHVIVVPEDTRNHKRAWCSLVPIGEACDSVSSTGLKWNLDNQPLKFGDVVSTSNTFSGCEKVTIKCSHPMLWSMRIPSWKSVFLHIPPPHLTP